jgi:hypothetical protein
MLFVLFRQFPPLKKGGIFNVLKLGGIVAHFHNLVNPIGKMASKNQYPINKIIRGISTI